MGEAVGIWTARSLFRREVATTKGSSIARPKGWERWGTPREGVNSETEVTLLALLPGWTVLLPEGSGRCRISFRQRVEGSHGNNGRSDS